MRRSRTSEATEREPKASCGLRQQRTSERSSRVSLRVSRHTRVLIKISKVIINIRYEFIMRYDREAVISLYKIYSQSRAMGAGIINMRKSTRSVDFHMLIMNSPQGCEQMDHLSQVTIYVSKNMVLMNYLNNIYPIHLYNI